MRSVRMAICTSGEPVSFSWVRNFSIVAALSGMVSCDLGTSGVGARAGGTALASTVVAKTLARTRAG